MSEHLEAARRVAESESAHSSPDTRSVPYLLNGILHALIAIAETDERAATCPHGMTGLCMYCVRDFDLLRATS